MTVSELQAEMQRAVEGKPLTGRWQRDYMPERRRWMGGVSNNLPRMAMACVASFRPVEAAAWWLDLLEEEWGERGLWDAQEPGSRTYGGATWAAEATTLAILRRALPDHAVIGALERSLTRRAAWYALTGVQAVTAQGGRGQVVYLGMGSLTTGGRSNHFENHEADHLLHRVLTGARPPVELHATNFTALVDALMQVGGDDWSGVPKTTREWLHALVAAEGADLELVSRAVALLGPARTSAPLMVRRYRSGTLACTVEWNPSGNTSCAFLVASRTSERPLRLRDQVAWLHPYGEAQRVRGGTKLGDKILGRGETWWDGDVFHCANLTPAEELRKGGPRHVLSHALPPLASVLWEVRLSPDAPPRLGGGSGLISPPPPPPPPPDKPDKPTPPPPPENQPPIPASGRHVTFRGDGADIIINILPGGKWEGRRFRLDGGDWQTFR